MVDFPSLDPTTRRLPDVVRAQIAADLKDNTQVEGTAISQLLSGVSAKPTAGWASTDLATAVQTSLGKADSALQVAPVTSVGGKTGAVTLAASDVGAVPVTRTVAGKALSGDVMLAKADVGLGSVDNTADTAKPISTAVQAVFDVASQDVVYTGTGWPASSATAVVRRFISVGYPSAAAPVGLVLGDLWFRDKAAS
jgi:hypothetical protein